MTTARETPLPLFSKMGAT
uniref:Uncharacterized protein n=1 Tax=Arundo donax TaxID=35708 RepID=A0A0A8ZN36_ARUDO